MNSVEEKVDLKQSRKKREISQKFQSLFGNRNSIQYILILICPDSDELKKKHSEFPISSMWYSDMSLLNIMANGLPPGVELKRIEGYSKDNIDEIYECLDDVTFAKKPLPTEDPPTASRTVDRRTPNQIAAESVDMISRLPAVFANPAAFANPVAFTNVNYAAMVGAVVDPANITGWRQTSLEQIHANIFVQQDQDFEGQADENDPSAASVNVLEPTAGVAAAPAPSNKRKKTRSRR